jgi:elongation factor G
LKITTPKEYSSRVYSDLTKKNATDVSYNEADNIVFLSARLPLAKLGSYSSELRKLTSGNTTFTIELDTYEPINQKEYQELLEKKSL